MQARMIRNNTPSNLTITGTGGWKLDLAPLEQRQIVEEGLQTTLDLTEAERDGLVSAWDVTPVEVVENIVSIVFVVGVSLGMVCGIISKEGAPEWFSGKEAWPRYVWTAGGFLFGVIVSGLVIWKTRSLRLVLRFLVQMVSLLVILAIGLGLPAATIYVFGGGKRLLDNPSPELFARLLQLGFIATASLLPTLLFFLFDRYQLSTLRSRLYRDLFRLDRTLKTRSQIDAKHGSEIEEAYGPEDQGRGRLAPGTRWPVLVCALVVTLGWLTAFKPVGELGAAAIQNPLVPERSALTFGFLGAYFFCLQLIARRYGRGDLKPKAYGYITIRILIVAVLSSVLDATFHEPPIVVLVFAFLCGIVPEEFFTLIKERFRGRGTDRIVPEAEKHPLTKLEGIDLYDRARLEQEGIANVESFAHHDLIHLVLETQIPVPRLVDWMDQAILYLHTIEEPKDEARKKLREYGIRTTTDLLACWQAADARKELGEFKRLLGGERSPYRLEIIRDSLLDDEWLKRVQDWRNESEREAERVEAVPRSFEYKLRLATHLENEGRYKDAVQAFEKALEIRDDAEARVKLASLLAKAPVHSVRDVKRSREHAKRAFELGQGDAEVLMSLVDVQEELGDTGDALRTCDQAILAFGDPGEDKAKKEEVSRLNQRAKDLRGKLSQQQPVRA